MKILKISVRSIFFSLIILLAFFQNWLLIYIPAFGFLDEIIAVVALTYFVLSGKISKKILKLAVCTLVIIMWGLLCNFIFKIQSSGIAIFEDVISNFKFLFIYLGMREYMLRKGLQTGGILLVVLKVVKIYMLSVFCFAILNIIMDVNMDAGVRYGIRMFSFVYVSPGHLINQMTYAIILLSAEIEYFGKKNYIWQLICAFIMICTMKTRAFLLIAVYLTLIYFIKYRKKKRLGFEVVIIGIIIFLIGYSQFEHYFFVNGTPRQMFVGGAITLMKEYFPFGTGFATYGSSAAADFYSPLYYELGFNTRWGMTPDTKQFLNDNYFPMIFAEFGLLFGILFLIMTYKYCKIVLADVKRNDSVATRVTTFFFVFDIILSSIQSSYLAHYSVVTLTLVFIIFFYPNKREVTIRKNDY